MKRMLINATQQEELRMAMVDGQRLYDLNIELAASERKKANIYKGKITRIEPSLEAAFVDFGAERHGFLPLKEISSEYFVKPVDSGGKPNIKDVLREGQDIVVQIDKEERGNKGAALTTFVSLAGRFIVLKPNKERSGGVSRRIVGSDRDLARKSLNDIEVPKGMSVILRTAGIDRSPEELAWDLENLLTIWTAILNVVLERKSPFLIYRESNAVVRALRDYLAADIGEILIDDDKTFKEACEFVEQVMPHNLKKIKHYTEPVPLFTRFQIESQIESAFTHSVNLPSGGSIVIDHTEALVSIDINSARATKGGDIEATALNTNLEAADEIARQLRIRDLGGLIVIDFIDMGPQKNQREVENRLREAVRQDRARVQIGKISRFGLLEMSRQRLRPSLGESSYLTCPRCSGIGTIRSVESLALAILRIIGEEARKERTAKVIAQLPVEVATFLLNEKRDWVQNLESRNEMQVVLVANPALETPHYEVRRVRDDQTELPENTGPSYELADAGAEPETPQEILARKQIEPAAIAVMKPSKPAPKRKEESKARGLLATIASFFKGEEEPEQKKSQSRRRKSSGSEGRTRGGQRSRSGSDSSRKQDQRGDTRKKTTRKKASKKKVARKKAAKKKATGKQAASGQAETPQADKSQAQDQQQAEAKQPSRSRRSRGGRRRRRSGERPQQDQQGAESGQDKRKEAAAQPEQKAEPARDQRKPADKGQNKPPELLPAPAPKPKETQKKPEAKESVEKPSSGNGSAKAEPAKAPAPRPEPAATPKAEPKPEPKAEPKSEPKTESQPETQPKPRPQPEQKPEGRLLPWDD